MNIYSVAVSLPTLAQAVLLTNQYPSPFTGEKTGLPGVVGRKMAPEGPHPNPWKLAILWYVAKRLR